jgi:hypothetical protein
MGGAFRQPAEVFVFHLQLLFDRGHRLTHLRFGEGKPPADSAADWVEVGSRRFRYAGLKAICLLAVRAKQRALRGGGKHDPAEKLLQGKKGSAAQTLYYLKESAWSAELFRDRHREFYDPGSNNDDGKRREYFTIDLLATLPADHIRVGQGDRESPLWYDLPEHHDLLEALRASLECALHRRNRSASVTKRPPGAPTLASPKSYALPRQMRVAVLLGSTNLPYTDAIFRALKRHMMEDVALTGPVPIVDRVKSLPDDATDVATGEQLARKFREDARSADYWVMIGSPACVALRRSYGEQGQPEPEKLEPEKPLLALGVTNPATLALPTQAPHDRRVAVVRYGSGMAHYANLLDEIVFRDLLPKERRRFAFVYTRGIKHDDGAAKELEGLPTVGSGRLKLCPFPAHPTGKELKEVCGDRIIWGWYTIEFLLKEGRLDPNLEELMVVSTIHEHAHKGLSAVAVQPLDEEIGRLGANWLLEDFATGDTPGHSFNRLPVRGAPDYFWLNLEVLERWERRLGFRLSEQVEHHDHCKGVYGARRASDDGR